MAAGVLFADVLTHAPGRALFAASTRKAGVIVPDAGLHSDARYGGIYRLRGTAKVAGTPDVPVVRRVCLYHQNAAGLMARETWSLPDGSYDFKAIEKGPWFVIAHDHTGEYNAVIADNVLAEPM